MQYPYYNELNEIFLRAIAEKISHDGKLLADALPKRDIYTIKTLYDLERVTSDFNFNQFFVDNFTLGSSENEVFITDNKNFLDDHIRSLWNVLERSGDPENKYSSLIPLPYPYIVPGGRFKEIYYWDSYFTMLGLAVHQKFGMIESMIQNFAYLIDTMGYIPNGNRTYYEGRSQPPFFSHMVSLLADLKGEDIYQRYLPQMIKEANFFAKSDRQISVQGHQLTIYYDTNSSPRIEMYEDDLDLAKNVSNKEYFYKNVRAACESGWDFSSRWLSDPNDLSTIQTTDIIPIDLNCLLYHLETTIAKHTTIEVIKNEYEAKATQRQAAILEILWSQKDQCFMDYNYTQNKHTNVISCAGLYPIFIQIATPYQAQLVKVKIEEELLKNGGLASTNINTKQQWDSPNGWAPLQWIGVKGLMNYGYHDLALKITQKWTNLNEKVFASTGKMMEKYNVVDMSLLAGGGEYDVQDGFGWTNGVYLALREVIGNKSR
jgi:alpha,alpha-trehalase